MTSDIQELRGSVLGVTILLASLFLGGPAAAQRNYTPPPPPLDTPACVPTKKTPCPPPEPASTSAPPAPAGARFPFPGEAPGGSGDRAAGATPAASLPADPSRPNAPHPALTPQDAAAAHPFPSEPAPDLAPADTPAGTSHPEPGESSSASPDIADKASEETAQPPARRHLPKVEDMRDREAEDLEVAHFYLVKGDFQAAYLRAKDATRIMPEDSDAEFILGEAARGLGHADESAAAYKRYLELEPDGTRSRAARKALITLAGK